MSRLAKKPCDSMRDMNIFALEETFVKTIIGDTIETYSGQWRLIHEAIQNAHDAIQRNANISEGSIEVRFSVASNTISVRDNGEGIPIENFPFIFLIGGTDKGDPSLMKILKGSQGVGIKSTLFTSTSFKVETVREGKAWEYELTDCYKFKDPDFKQEIEAPTPKPSSSPSGSTFTYSLYDYSIQDFINEIVREYCRDTKADLASHSISSADELKVVLETYFRTRTYLGCVQALLAGGHHARKPIQVRLVLEFDSDKPEMYADIDLDYCTFFANEELYNQRLSQTFTAKYLDVLELHAAINNRERADKVYPDFKEVLNNPPDQTNKKLLVQKFDRDTVKALLSRARKNQQTGSVEFTPDSERLHRHRKALEYVNGMYLVIGQKNYLIKYFHVGTRQTISVNGLPTNIPLATPIGALAYLNNIHLVLDVDCTLGFGKRNLPGRTKGVLDAFYHDVWNMLRKVVPLVVGYREGVDASELVKWDKDEEFEHYKDSSNKFRESSLSFKTTPKEEQEVIALFFELVGRGMLKGYFPFRVGGQTVYDGLFYIDKSERVTIPQNIKASQLKRVEFKTRVSKLIEDFDLEKKFLHEIDLLICWEDDIKEDDHITEYSVHSLSRDNIDPYPGAQLRIQRRTDFCQVLVLKDYLESKKLI